MTNRWILRGGAAALVLSIAGLAAGGAGFFRMSLARSASLARWSDARCAAFVEANPGAADPCAAGGRPRVLPEYERGRRDVEGARRALERGDDVEAAARLASALDRVARIERGASFIATLVASKLADEALDVIDERPQLGRAPEIRRALLRTELRTARHPLETERLHQLAASLAAPPARLVTWGATEARMADDAERGDAVLATMERAIRQGDRAACERAAREEGGGFGAPFNLVLCEKAEGVVRAERRLARARTSVR